MRKGGAAARDDAGAGGGRRLERAGRPNARAANSVITHTPIGPHASPTARSPRRPPSSTPPKDVALKDPKDWKIAGKPLKRLDTADKLTGKQVYGMDLKLPGMLNAAIRDCPVFGGKVKSFDAAAMQACPASRRSCAWATPRWRWSPTPGGAPRRALDALPIEWDEGPNAKLLERRASPAMLKAGLDADRGRRRQPERRRAAALARRREEGRGGVRVPAPEPRDDGADERDGALDARALRGLDADAERRGRARGRRPKRPGLPLAQVRGLQDPCSAAASAAAAPCTTGSARRCAIAKEMPGTPVKLDLVARRGHAARPLPPGHAVQADRRPRRAGQRHRAAHAHLGPVDPGRRRAAEHQGRQGPGRVPGPRIRRRPEGVDRLHDSRTC